MKVRRFKRDDYSELARWYEGHGQPVPPPDMLSDLGIIVEGVCAGFVLLTNSAVCLIDSLVTNPEASGEERHKALVLLGDALVEAAKESGAKVIMGLSGIPSIEVRMVQMGFTPLGQITAYAARL